MASKYYCLIAGLPDMLLGDKKTAYTSQSLLDTLNEELSTKDLNMVQALYFPFDHKNLLQLIYKENKEFDSRGVYNIEDLEPLTDKKNLDTLEDVACPSYMMDFVKQFWDLDKMPDKIQADILLTQKYYAYLRSFKNSFLNEYLDFEVNQKNIFIALNGRKYKLNIENEFIGDNDIIEYLQNNRSRDFGLAGELEYIEPMIQLFEETNILERELKIDHLKWHFIEDASFFNYFTIERVMAFVYKLFIVERWLLLSEEEGKKLFQKLLKELETSYEFPEEYKLSHGKK